MNWGILVGFNKSKLDIVVQRTRAFWWKYVIYTLTSGIIVLFSCSIIYDKKITIEIMNSWVGIILGLIALVIGIISMFLSFYNLDQSIQTQKETLTKIDNIKKEIIDYIDKSSERTIGEIHNQQKPEFVKPRKDSWGNVKK